ncbi:MAG: alpha-amylase family glycosyl hydrolase [Rhodospirillaceae bacterium]|nr:alpha-amylase family glycosyl hydrolase [Rhodospirillaceae bacterium]
MTAPWWHGAVVYQVYPRSFQDSNGDGVGDLNGIAARLDHLVDLGVDAVWLSPVYPSPMADFGYDVSDYTGIDPLFGTMADFDRLLAAVHTRGLKLIMDLVPNHTSTAHPWFLQARAARQNPRRDWYVWADPAPGGGPPNNWISEFGGPAWTRDAVTGQYYYHAFLATQPDLNWRNPQVQDAIEQVMRFWLDKGVDGFRLDTVQHLFEDERLRDNPPNPDWRPGQPPTQALRRLYTTDRPELFRLLPRWRTLADSFGDRVLISEAYVPLAGLAPYYGANNDSMHLPFNFHLIGARWNAAELAALIRDYDAIVPAGAWPNWVLGNHDRSRIAARVGADQAAAAALLLLTLRGTPTMYYGDELGLSDVPIPPDRVQDPWEKNVSGYGLGRDPVRTPMPWSAAANGGFSAAPPWLPLNADFAARNVAAQRADPDSLLNLYRRVLALRRAEPALALGDLVSVGHQGDVLWYIRQRQGRALTVALNLGPRPATWTLPAAAPCRVVLSTARTRAGALLTGSVELASGEGMIVEAAP